MAVAPDGRIFVAQKGGGVRVVKDGAIQPKSFVIVPAETSYEYGLCGIVLDPDFTSNGYVYLNYIAKGTPTRNIIERFTAVGDVAAAGSQTTIFELDTVNPPGPTGNYHVGGAMHFGADGKLYIATGDNTTPADAQSLSNLHGKILRINRDGSIPADNPFFDTVSGRNRAIWAYGFRNPFTFAIQPGSGRILINDVGQNSYEEINLGRAGANYGWPLTEGPTADTRFQSPLHAYRHKTTTKGAACIAGGVFYDPATVAMPAMYVGRYFFADFNNGFMSTVDPDTGVVESFATDINTQTVDIDVGPDGAIYYLSWGNGRAVTRISYTGDLRPSISSGPKAVTVASGQAATFSVSATGDGSLSYRWQRAEPGSATFVDISGGTQATLNTGALSPSDSEARYRVVVSNRHGSVRSNAAMVTVIPNAPPTITLKSPGPRSRFSGGEVIAFSATAFDDESGLLPASSMNWKVDMLHGAVTRPIVPPTPGGEGAFVVPDDTPYTRTDVTLRLTVSARDPLTAIVSTSSIDLRPRVRVVTLASTIPGAVLSLEGEPRSTPYAVSSVVGFQRTITASPYQVAAGGFQRFLGWQHGGARTQVVQVPLADVTYTATYVASPIFVADFDDAEASVFRPLQGMWQLDAGGAYRGNAHGVAMFDAATSLPSTFELGAEIRLDADRGDGYLIFDVKSSKDFKYVGLRAAEGRIVAGHRTSLGWSDSVSAPVGLMPGGSVPLCVRVTGTSISAFVNDQPILSHDFQEPLFDGTVGLATRSRSGLFDRFFVRTGADQREVFCTKTTIQENQGVGALVGILGTRGWGYGATFRYELAAGPGDADNQSFLIQGDRLIAAERFNFERKNSYQVRVRSIEGSGVVSERAMVIVIEDDAGEARRIDAVVTPAAGLYAKGDSLVFQVQTSLAASVTGRPTLPFRLGASLRLAAYSGGSGTTSLTFTYVVQAGEQANRVTLGGAIQLPARSAIKAGRSPFALGLPNAGALLPDVILDAAAPQPVGSLETPAAGVYRTGDLVRFRMTYSEAVVVSGSASIRLVLGTSGRTVAAGYESGSGTNVLTFVYQVTKDDAMPSGRWIRVADRITLSPGGSITDVAGNDARLSLKVPGSTRFRFIA